MGFFLLEESLNDEDFKIFFLSLSWGYRRSQTKSPHYFQPTCPCCVSQKKCITSLHPSMPSLHTCFVCLSFRKPCTWAFYLQEGALKSLHWATVPGTMAGGQVKPLWEVRAAQQTHTHTWCTEALIFQGKTTSFTVFMVWMRMPGQQY